MTNTESFPNGRQSRRATSLAPVVGPLLALGIAWFPASLPAQGVFIRGDCDQSYRLDISDPINALGYLFLGTSSPSCLDACDADDSGKIDITDVIKVLHFLFLGGPPPNQPFPLDSADPSTDSLTCANGREPPEELRVSPPEVIFHRVGASIVLSVISRSAQGILEDIRTNPSTLYSSADRAVAEVTSQGIVTARAVGVTTVNIRFRGVIHPVPVKVLPGADGSPIVRITTPPDGSLVTSASVILGGFVSDPLATLRFGAETLLNQDGSFRALAALAPGTNVLEVIATGGTGEGRALVTVTRVEPGSPGAVGPDGKPLPRVVVPVFTPSDNTPPAVAITSPSSGAVFLGGGVMVAGTVDDSSATVRVNGVLAALDGGSFHARLALPPGTGIIRAEAVDPVGNRTEASVEVTVDTTLPRISITDPPGDIPGDTGARPIVRGTVDPPGSPVIVNGVAAQVVGAFWSAEVGLVAGWNDVIATTSLPGGLPRRAQAVRAVFVDADGPEVEVVHPPESKLLSPAGQRVETATVRIAGRVRDPGAPQEIDDATPVTIGGVAAQVGGGTFSVEVAIAAGVNDLQLVATDTRGKQTTRTLRVVRGGAPGRQLAAISGDGVTVEAGQSAPIPLVATALGETGQPLKGVQLRFDVALGGGFLSGGVRSRTMATGVDGRASVLFSPGRQAGPGSQVILVTGPAANSPFGFVLHASPTAARVLAAHRRRLYTGSAGQALPERVQIRLVDNFGNPIAGETIIYRVIEGAATMGGGTVLPAGTDASGLASVAVTTPPATDSRSVVEAAHASAPAVLFEIFGLAPGPAADTAVSGAVLDDLGQPVEGARVLAALGGSTLEAVTDLSGGFRLSGAPAGDLQLAVEAPGFVAPAVRAFLAAGKENRLPAPLRVSRSENGPRTRVEVVSETRGALITLPALPGLRLSIAPGAARFPDGTRAGAISLIAPNLALLPSPLPDDSDVEAPIAILPEGVRFDPPADLTLPNLAERAGGLVPLFVHRSAAGGFLELPSGVVGSDGLAVQLEDAAALRTGGVIFATRRGPRAGRTGVLSGRLAYPAPGFLDVPQRGESGVLGCNVYAHSGEMFVDEVDLELPAPGRGLSYRFRRRYESRHSFRGSLGHGWEHEYEDRRLYQGLASGNVVRATGDGHFGEYLLDAVDGRYISPAGVFSRLWVDGEGFLVERDRDGMRHRYHSFDGSSLAGRLESIADRHGNSLRCRRGADGLLIEVRDSLERTVAYAHDGEGRITSIADFTGRQVRFEYDAAGDLVAATGPAITITPNENDFPDGKRTEYAYTSGFADARSNHNLVRIVDPREAASTKIPRVTATYGEDPSQVSFDRVVSQVWGGTNATGVSAGGTVMLHYDSLRGDLLGSGLEYSLDAEDLEGYLLSAVVVTTYTDQEGRIQEMVSSGAGLPLELRIHTRDGPRPRDPSSLHPPPGIAPPYYETRWSWTREGLLASMSMPRGDRIVCFYDETSPVRHAQAALLRREHHPAPLLDPASPAVTTYKVDPLFGIVVEEVSPRGNDPDYSPPIGGPSTAARYTTRRLLDYQEGSLLPALAAEGGIAEADLAAALARADIALGLGDLNEDGALNLRSGNVVKLSPPAATLPDGATDTGSTLLSYNHFGQLILQVDASGRKTRFRYHPASDYNGDGAPDPGAGLDPVTGGFLARRIIDVGLPGSPAEVVAERFVYDQRGHVVHRANGNGNEELQTRNALGQLVELRLPPPLRYRRHYDYDADDNLTRVRVENFTSTDGGGHFLVSANRWLDTGFEYDLLGRAVTVTREVSEGEVGPARSIVTHFRYHPSGPLQRLIHPVASTEETWEYDERGLVTSHRKGAGTADEALESFFHDEGGNRVFRRSPSGVLEERRYDGFNRLAAVIDAAGGARVFDRDIEGQVIAESMLGSPGGPTPVTPDGTGNVLLSRTCFDHDERGRVFRSRRAKFEVGFEASAEQLVEETFFDGADRPLRRLDPTGGEWIRQYDGAGRLHRETAPDRSVRSFTRDGNGNPISEVREVHTLEPVDPSAAGDPEYDAEGRYRETFTILRAFDPLNRLTLLVDPKGGVWRARYDSLGSLIFVSDAMGSSTSAEADPEFVPILALLTGRQRQNLNDHGNRRRYVYDNLGRLVEAQHELRSDGNGGAPIDPTNPFNQDGIITERLEWDEGGRLAAWVDDAGNRAEITYDSAGYVKQKKWPDGTLETHSRDRDGGLRAITDPTGNVITQELDVLGRLAGRSIARATGVLGTSRQRFEHDGLGRMTFAYDDNDPENPGDDSRVTLRHDSCGNIVEDFQGAYRMEAVHDLASRVVSRRYPGGHVLQVARDAAGRISELADASGARAAYRHFGSGALLEKVLASGFTLYFLRGDDSGILRNKAYDAVGEKLEVVYTDPTGEPVHGFTYGRDRSGNQLYEKPLHRFSRTGDVWRYDSVYRIQKYLPNVFDPLFPPIDPLEKIVYYPNGNHSWRFLEVDFSVRRLDVNAWNAYTKYGDDLLTYDAGGNLLTDLNLRFAYDALGRVVRVERAGRLAAIYRYDAAGAQSPEDFLGKGRRIEKDVVSPGREQPAGVSHYVFAGESVAEVRDGTGVLIDQYYHEEEASPSLAPGRGVLRPAILLRQRSAAPPVVHELLHDAAGSVTGIIGPSGSIEETVRYGVHGEPQVINRFGNPIEYPGLGNTLLFGGLVHDFESGQHSAGARYFRPRLGRFLTNAGPLFPRNLLELNGYLFPGLPALPGDVAGRSSITRRADYLEPFRVEVLGASEEGARIAPAPVTSRPLPPAPGWGRVQ